MNGALVRESSYPENGGHAHEASISSTRTPSIGTPNCSLLIGLDDAEMPIGIVDARRAARAPDTEPRQVQHTAIRGEVDVRRNFHWSWRIEPRHAGIVLVIAADPVQGTLQ